MSKFAKKSTDEEKKQKRFNRLFPEDNSSFSETDDEEGDTTLSYAKKITTKRPTKILPPSKRKLPLAKHSDLKKVYTFKKCKCVPKPSLEEEIIISSDEELEKSMVEMELPSIENSDTD